MSLCKAIVHGKEHRQPYRGSKAIDWSCTNHHSCVYCRDNRLHNFEKWKLIAEDTRKQYFNRWRDKMIEEEWNMEALREYDY